MGKEIIWILGTSAAGKETFIKNIVNGVSDNEQFEWQDKQVSFVTSSVDYIGQFEDDPVVEKRAAIVSEAKTLVQNNDVVLIKWQFVDSQTDRLNQLKKDLPQIKHKIIVLSTLDQELEKRLINKSWWQEDWDVEKWVIEEKEMIQKEIQNYQDDFKVVKILNTLEDE